MTRRAISFFVPPISISSSSLYISFFMEKPPIYTYGGMPI